MSYKGFFRPKNPSKYRGNSSQIIYRSLWELKLMNYLDLHKDVIQWSSEELTIPYRSPIDGKVHRYFPDFVVKKRTSSGTVETVMIEVKPKKQTVPPTPQTAKSKKYIREVMTWGINSAKWKAAQSFCEDKKWKFQIMTEDDLGI